MRIISLFIDVGSLFLFWGLREGIIHLHFAQLKHFLPLTRYKAPAWYAAKSRLRGFDPWNCKVLNTPKLRSNIINKCDKELYQEPKERTSHVHGATSMETW
jgi:hypothetical protein